MYKWNGRVAVITGASTAIGQAICKALVENGLTVCAIAKETGVAKLDVRRKFFSSCFFSSHIFRSLTKNIFFFSLFLTKTLAFLTQ